MVQSAAQPSAVLAAQPSAVPAAQPSAVPVPPEICQIFVTSGATKHHIPVPPEIRRNFVTSGATEHCDPIPAAQPSAVPAVQPSAMPAAQPSAVPAAQPSAMPVPPEIRWNFVTSGATKHRDPILPAQPSAVPTSLVKSAMTLLPAVQPSTIPAAQPSATPTVQPSAVPAAQPSAVPPSPTGPGPPPLAPTGPGPPKQYHQHPYDPDWLDWYIEEIAQKYETSRSWGDFICDVRGQGDLHPNVAYLQRPAAHLLDCFHKSGTPPIISSSPWTLQKIAVALKCGPHSSSIKGIEFLRNKYADMVEKQQWIVLPASMLKSMFGLCLSPLGLVPQRDRRDCMILDYSYFDVN